MRNKTRLACPACGHNKWFSSGVDARTPVIRPGEKLKECGNCGMRVFVITPPTNGESELVRTEEVTK